MVRGEEEKNKNRCILLMRDFILEYWNGDDDDDDQLPNSIRRKENSCCTKWKFLIKRDPQDEDEGVG